jgi:hypothetical protein
MHTEFQTQYLNTLENIVMEIKVDFKEIDGGSVVWINFAYRTF